jgi:hypothetical protein
VVRHVGILDQKVFVNLLNVAMVDCSLFKCRLVLVLILTWFTEFLDVLQVLHPLEIIQHKEKEGQVRVDVINLLIDFVYFDLFFLVLRSIIRAHFWGDLEL